MDMKKWFNLIDALECTYLKIVAYNNKILLYFLRT